MRAPFANTIISVETVDGWVDLNGPDAIERLPQAAPLHVLTAWDTGFTAGFNNQRSRKENEKWQQALLDELWAFGYLVVHKAFGRPSENPTGLTERSYTEDWAAVSGLTRDEACKIAKRYEQTAIFEVTEQHVTYVLAATVHPLVDMDRV